ncbi:hypothetical protein P609_11390 [Comamonas thiooxydans]|nr:hypothetical protein P609_11390 [Comamonas thiooxydans]
MTVVAMGMERSVNIDVAGQQGRSDSLSDIDLM